MQGHEVDANTAPVDAEFVVAVRQAGIALKKLLVMHWCVIAAGVLVSIACAVGVLLRPVASYGSALLGIMALSAVICVRVLVLSTKVHVMRRLLGYLEGEGPDFFFVSPRCGLVVFAPAGVFVERRLRWGLPYGDFLAYYDPGVRVGLVEHVRRSLVSIWYDEERHAIFLTASVAVQRLMNKSESSLTFSVPLPREITPSIALEQAVQANRRAAA